jgi:hypothetical protein
MYLQRTFFLLLSLIKMKTMNLKTHILLFTLLATNFCFTQEGTIEIEADPRIETLIEEQGSIDNPSSTPQMNGFRIQLFFDSDRKAVEEARNKFVTKYPKIDTYIVYNAPHYFLRVGNFRTRLEGEKVKSTLETDFPTSYIIKETINLPRID